MAEVVNGERVSDDNLVRQKTEKDTVLIELVERDRGTVVDIRYVGPNSGGQIVCYRGGVGVLVENVVEFVDKVIAQSGLPYELIEVGEPDMEAT